MLSWLKYLVFDPPPLAVFELTEQRITAIRRDHRTLEIAARAEVPIAPGVMDASAVRPNVLDAEQLGDAIVEALDQLGPIRRPEAALILPDACSRLTVLEFDNLPPKTDKRESLIRFRLAKSVPFDVETCRLAYKLQTNGGGFLALVSLTPEEVVRQYEEAFEQVGLWPGLVTSSMAAALNLASSASASLFVKLAGRSMTMAAIDEEIVKLVRTVDVNADPDSASEEALRDMVADLYPTLVYLEDNLGAPVRKLELCGFGELLRPAIDYLGNELHYEIEAVSGPAGLVGSSDAGIWGYLGGAA